jgi:hypothetical protein
MEVQQIIAVIFLMIVLYNLDPRTTLRIIIYPLLGFMVVMEVIVSLIKYVLGVGR